MEYIYKPLDISSQSTMPTLHTAYNTQTTATNPLPRSMNLDALPFVGNPSLDETASYTCFDWSLYTPSSPLPRMLPEYSISTSITEAPLAHPPAVAARDAPFLPYLDSEPTVSPCSPLVATIPPSLYKPLALQHPAPDVSSLFPSTHDTG